VAAVFWSECAALQRGFGRGSARGRSTARLVAADTVEAAVELMFPGVSRVVTTEAVDGVSMSTVFWSVVEGVSSESPNAASNAAVCFVEADAQAMPLLESFAKCCNAAGIAGLAVSAACVGDGVPTLHFAVEAEPFWASAAAPATEADTACAVGRVRAWVQDVIVDSKVCPFTSSADVAGTGLSAAGVVPGAVLYPVCDAAGTGSTAIVGLLGAFWRATVDLLSQPPEDASSTLLVAPLFAKGDYDGFVRGTEIIVRNLQLVGADDDAALVFFHPNYDRDHPALKQDRPTHGHLPPSAWLPAYLRLTRSAEEVDALSAEQLASANYQRRAPCAVLNILRADQVERAEVVVPSALIEPTPGRRVRVTGARVYAQNTWRLATQATRKTDAQGHEYLVVSRQQAADE